MTAALPEIEVGEIAAWPSAARSRIPGVAAIRATSGFQRGMLFAGADHRRVLRHPRHLRAADRALRLRRRPRPTARASAP